MPSLSKSWIGLICLILVVGLIFGTIRFISNLLVISGFICAAVITGLGWLAKRALIDKALLPKTGLEIPLLLFLFTASASLGLSPAPRIGLEKLAWYFVGAFLFFLLVDVFKQPEIRWGLLSSFLIVTAVILFSALLDTYAIYMNWWDQVGSFTIMPPFQVRFTSMAGHANIFMALMNLAAPFAFVLFIRAQQRGIRVLAAMWVVMFAFALPFSSSRGGWLGTAGWVSILFALWLAEDGRWKRYWGVLRQRLAIAVPVGLLVIALAGVAAFQFYQVFAGVHPSHGSGSGLNREGIWSSTLHAWQLSPWTGVGVGRLGVELLRTAPSFPAQWWPGHAHSTPLQILAEVGLIGFLQFLLINIVALILFIRAYRATPRKERIWAAASLAALASAAFHGIFEEFTSHPALLIPPIAHAAFVLVSAGPVERFKRVPISILILPGLFTAAVAINYVWGYTPHYAMASQKKVVNWLAAAQGSAESARRDPSMPFYHSQTALAYAMAWHEDANPQLLASAKQSLNRALEIEPNNSVFWADFAVLNWYNGKSDQSFDAIEQAITLCPSDTNNYILYGWFLEQAGEVKLAIEQYQKGLGLNPSLAQHPFWQESQTRRLAVNPFVNISVSKGDHWAAAQEALTAGDLPAAKYELALSVLSNESDLAIISTRATLASYQGDFEKYRQNLEDLLAVIEDNYWGRDVGIYYFLFLRRGYPSSVVPGYINVTEDFGQFTHLRSLFDLQLAAGECEEAAFTWQVYQRELHAGELIPGGYPPMPACPTKLQGGT